MLAISCFVGKNVYAYTERDGSSAAISFGVNVHVFNKTKTSLSL